ncbi:MAG: outer membrane beta-barrel protein [Marinifilaceae bacterium]
MPFTTKILLLFLCIIYNLQYCFSQESKIQGKVTCKDNQAISNASVIAFSQTNSSILNYTTTDSLGCFVLYFESNGDSILLETRHLAFATDSLFLARRNHSNINVHMRPHPYYLDEVKIQAERVPLQYRNGDIVVDVESFSDKSTVRGVDVLRKLPGVFVNEQRKEILLNGKQVELQIDGRKQNLSFDILKAIPVEALDQLVLIPNKRAEHDGDAGNAIINIKTKKSFIDGYVGSMDGNYGNYKDAGWPGEAQGSFFTMIMKKNFYLNFSFTTEVNVDKSEVYDSTYYGESNSYIINNQITAERPWATVTNMNMSWDVYRGHRINTNIYAFTRKWDKTLETNAHDMFKDKTHYNATFSGTRWNISGNIEYETSDSLPYKLKLSYGYIDAGEDTQNKNTSIYSDRPTYMYELTSKPKGAQHIVKADFQKKDTYDKWALNAGVKANMGETNDKSKYTPSSETLMDQYLDYRERVYSGYLSGGLRVSQKIYASVGISGEFTNYDLKLLSTDTADENNYWSVLPTASVSFNLHSNYNTSLSVSSAVGRPNYNLLLSSEKWHTDKYYSRGNPFLQPYKNYTMLWGNTLFRKLNLNLGGEYTKDFYNQVLLDKGNQITESTYLNCFDSWTAIANFSLPIGLLKGKLFFNFTGSGKYGRYSNIRNGFTLPEGRNLIAEASASFYFEYWFTTKYRSKIYGSGEYSILSKNFQNAREPNSHINIGVQFKCLKNKPLYLIAFANDVFSSEQHKITSFYDSNTRYFHQKYKNQGLFLGLSFNFQGGKDLKREQSRDDANHENKRFDEKE